MRKKRNLNKAKQSNQTESKLVKSKIVRIIIFIVGFLSFIAGTIGIFLPILPTTPLYLLASFCFVRSSERFNRWFLNSKLYKKHLENFAKTRAMIVKNEITLLLCVSALLLLTIFMVNNLTVTIILTILIICKYSYFVFKVKPISREEFEQMQLNRELEKAAKKKELEEALKKNQEVKEEC